tara:strand:+ start:457 stop:1332 length:876 start_codon:yes stop_codon:yes gene_type:complete
MHLNEETVTVDGLDSSSADYVQELSDNYGRVCAKLRGYARELVEIRRASTVNILQQIAAEAPHLEMSTKDTPLSTMIPFNFRNIWPGLSKRNIPVPVCHSNIVESPEDYGVIQRAFLDDSAKSESDQVAFYNASMPWLMACGDYRRAINEESEFEIMLGIPRGVPRIISYVSVDGTCFKGVIDYDDLSISKLAEADGLTIEKVRDYRNLRELKEEFEEKPTAVLLGTNPVGTADIDMIWSNLISKYVPNLSKRFSAGVEDLPLDEALKINQSLEGNPLLQGFVMMSVDDSE